MSMTTILEGRPEIYEDQDPVVQHLIEIRTRWVQESDVEAVLAELKWYQSLRDAAESINDEDRITWKELHRRYQDLSDDQITELTHKLSESQNGNYINQ